MEFEWSGRFVDLKLVFVIFDFEKYPLSTNTTFHTYVWLSRIDPLKGPDIAAQAVNETGGKLILSGDIDRKKYEKYFF